MRYRCATSAWVAILSTPELGQGDGRRALTLIRLPGCGGVLRWRRLAAIVDLRTPGVIGLKREDRVPQSSDLG